MIKVEGRVVIEELKDKKWIKVYEKKNRIVDGGLTLMLSRLSGDTDTPISHIAVGDGEGETLDTQQHLNNEIARKEIADKTV